MPIRVLVVDDSVVVRRMVAEALGDDPQIEVVGTAANGSIALTMVKLLTPDLVTMDLEMPVMDGIEAVRQLRRRGDRCRIIMFTTIRVTDAKQTFAAIAAGANDFVTKPSSMIVGGQSLQGVVETLIPRIKALVPQAAESLDPGPVATGSVVTGSNVPGSNAPGSDEPGAASPPRRRATDVIRLAARQQGPVRPVRAVVIGASMGGSSAILEVLQSITRLSVPIVLVQHMAPVFTAQMAQWLDRLVTSTVLESQGGEELQPGHVYVAPGGHHLELRATARGARTVLNDGPLVNSCRPSVDTLFSSAVRAYGGDLLAVMLTGMGSDGLGGTGAVLAAGGTVLAQDEASSLVWGMPGAVAKAGFAHQVLPVTEIGAAIVAEVQRSADGRGASPGEL